METLIIRTFEPEDRGGILRDIHEYVITSAYEKYIAFKVQREVFALNIESMNGGYNVWCDAWLVGSDRAERVATANLPDI
jgi:hypothetical protein